MTLIVLHFPGLAERGRAREKDEEREVQKKRGTERYRKKTMIYQTQLGKAEQT